MRLGRTAFWRLFTVNAVIAAAVVAAWPQLSRLVAIPDMFAHSPMLAAFFLCLPIGWMGAQRLHDTGHSGWHAWLPLLPLLGMGFPSIPDFIKQNLLEMIWNGRGAEIPGMIGRYAVPGIIGLWLGGLLLAAGIVRTVFLWLEPGTESDNKYGVAQQKVQPATPAKPSLQILALQGRLPRIIFWPLVLANFALLSAVSYGLKYWGLENDLPLWRDVEFLFYLPTCLAAILRLHDRGRPGNLAVVVFLINIAAPLAEIFLTQNQISLMNIGIDFFTFYLLFQCWQPGDTDSNAYGPPPGSADAPLLVTLSPRAVSPPSATPRVTKAAIRTSPISTPPSRPSGAPGTRSFGRRA